MNIYDLSPEDQRRFYEKDRLPQLMGLLLVNLFENAPPEVVERRQAIRIIDITQCMDEMARCEQSFKDPQTDKVAVYVEWREHYSTLYDLIHLHEYTLLKSEVEGWTEEEKMGR